jgi:IS5 family transposase
MAVDACGIPVGFVTAPANRHDSPLLSETLDAAAGALGALPEATTIHLDRGYDSEATRGRLRERRLVAEISKRRASRPR